MKILTFWKSGGTCNHDNDHHRKSILNIVTKAIPYIGYYNCCTEYHMVTFTYHRDIVVPTGRERNHADYRYLFMYSRSGDLTK